MFFKIKNYFLLLAFLFQNQFFFCNNATKIKIPYCSLKLNNKSFQNLESFFNVIKFFTLFGALLGGMNGINKTINMNVGTNETLLNQLKIILKSKSIDTSKDILRGSVAGALTGTVFAVMASFYSLFKGIFINSNKLNVIETIDDSEVHSKLNSRYNYSTENFNEEYEQDDN